MLEKGSQWRTVWGGPSVLVSLAYWLTNVSAVYCNFTVFRGTSYSASSPFNIKEGLKINLKAVRKKERRRYSWRSCFSVSHSLPPWSCSVLWTFHHFLECQILRLRVFIWSIYSFYLIFFFHEVSAKKSGDVKDLQIGVKVKKQDFFCILQAFVLSDHVSFAFFVISLVDWLKSSRYEMMPAPFV